MKKRIRIILEGLVIGMSVGLLLYVLSISQKVEASTEVEREIHSFNMRYDAEITKDKPLYIVFTTPIACEAVQESVHRSYLLGLQLVDLDYICVGVLFSNDANTNDE